MRIRPLLPLFLCTLPACTAPGPTTPPGAEEPLTEPGKTFPVQGVLTGPQGILSTTEILRKPLTHTEVPLAGQIIRLADAKLQPLPEAPSTQTDAKGRFTLEAPTRAGFVFSRPASASAALCAFYREGTSPEISVASTMVAWRLAAAMASRSVSITSLDPARVHAVTRLVAAEITNGNLRPDYSLETWPNGLEFYVYKRQGELAKGFNALIPGMIPPKLGG